MYSILFYLLYSLIFMHYRIFLLFINPNAILMENHCITGGVTIPNSPLVCTVEAAGQARAKGEGLLSGHVGKAAHFIVTGTRSPPAVQVMPSIIYKASKFNNKFHNWIQIISYIIFFVKTCLVTFLTQKSLVTSKKEIFYINLFINGLHLKMELLYN